jgi:hypothetical protein
MMRFLLKILLISTLLYFLLIGVLGADTHSYVWEGTRASYWEDSYVKLHEPTDPNAVATVTFYNTYTHEGDLGFTLTWNDLTVEFEIEWNVDEVGSERIIVSPPEGYIAIPSELDVNEQSYGIIHIYRFYGM